MNMKIGHKFLLISIICLHSIVHIVTESSPCDIQPGFIKSARIEFEENTDPGSLLFTLPFIGTSNQISVQFRSNELNNSQIQRYFELDSKKFILKSSYDLDELRIDLIELVFICTNQIGQKNSMNTFLLYITINDVNNKVPQFISEPYKFQIKELTPVGTVVYKSIKAIDKDLPNKPNSQIAFSIVDGACSDYFEFPLTTRSDLAVRKLIQYDTFSTCNLTIEVKDHGYPQLSSTTVVEISVLDVDDKDPIFTENIYHGIIRRNSLPGSFINMSKEIRALDQDTGINATIIYNLNSNPNKLFAIDQQTGQITLQNSINDYDKTDYNLIVKAVQSDNKLKSALTMVKIEIDNVNEYPPRFEENLYDTTIMENAAPGTFVCRIHALDIDKNRIEYSIINAHETPFKIDKIKGTITVNGHLDYELKKEYVLTASANDGNFTVTTMIKISIINMVDRAPQFEFSSYNFKLKLPHDVYIGQVRAEDIEQTNKMKYVIKPLDPADDQLFCISQNGIIYTCPTITTESKLQNSKNTSHFNMNTEELASKFTKPAYRFNVSVSVYSSDLLRTLESHVGVRIEIEQTVDQRTEAYVLKGLMSGSTMATTLDQSSSFLDEDFFRDPRLVYVVVGGGVALVLLLSVCATASVWLKCSRSKEATKSYDQHQNGRGFKFFPTFGLFDSAAIENNKRKRMNGSHMNTDCSCSCSSRTSDSCKNSTSGISCLSESSAVFHSGSQQHCRPHGHMIKMDTLETCHAKPPTLSDYFNNNEVKVMKSSKLCGYSDLMTSSEGTIKTDDSHMVIVRQENDESYFENTYVHQTPNYIGTQEYYQVHNNNKNKEKKLFSTDQTSSSQSFPSNSDQSKTLDTHTRKKLLMNQYSSECSTSSSLLASSSCSSSPKAQRHSIKSPILLSFQPPANKINTQRTSNRTQQLSSSSSSNHMPVSYSSMESETIDNTSQSSNAVFNYHEPLSVNSETKFEDDLMIRNFSNRIGPLNDTNNYEANEESPRDSFRNHLDTCNTSLVKLTNILNGTGINEEKSFEAMPSDRSLVSASVDRFSDSEKDEVIKAPIACEKHLNQTFFSYHSEPPKGFRDTSNNSLPESPSRPDYANLITNLNVISIHKNEPASTNTAVVSSNSEAFLDNCMLVETSSFSSAAVDEDGDRQSMPSEDDGNCYSHGSKIIELKKKLGIQSEFFLDNQTNQLT